MISENLGGVCLIQETPTVMRTYRFTNSQWDTITSAASDNASIVSNGTFLTGAISSSQIDNNEKLNYMDQYNCESQASNDFICTAYQPDWEGG